MILANRVPLNVWGGGGYIIADIGANRAGKSEHVNCISVTDGIKINEQNKWIGIGPLTYKPNLKRFHYSYRKLCSV